MERMSRWWDMDHSAPLSNRSWYLWSVWLPLTNRRQMWQMVPNVIQCPMHTRQSFPRKQIACEWETGRDWREMEGEGVGDAERRRRERRERIGRRETSRRKRRRRSEWEKDSAASSNRFDFLRMHLVMRKKELGKRNHMWDDEDRNPSAETEKEE